MKKILLVSTVPISLKAFSLDFMKYLRNQGYDVEAASSHGLEVEYIKKEGVPRPPKPYIVNITFDSVVEFFFKFTGIFLVSVDIHIHSMVCRKKFIIISFNMVLTRFIRMILPIIDKSILQGNQINGLLD